MTKVVIIDAVTGEVIEREQTEIEKAQATADIAEGKAQAKAAADKASARQAVLDRLGITADEAALLLG
tara:strand:- start:172 stop:375 length:204 start_codon:yes stop_codon:yes gene_type:complete